MAALAVAALAAVLLGCGGARARAGGVTATASSAPSAAGGGSAGSAASTASAGATPSGSGSAGAPSSSPDAGASGLGRAIPAGFLGMSLEIKALEPYLGTDPTAIDPVFVRLVAQIAPAQGFVLRIAGDSTDWSWWPVAHVARPPGIKYVLTPTWTSVARALAQQTHARLILGVNLEADSVAVAATEAHQLVSRLGPSFIDALELGNEPELYGSFGWYRSPSGQPVTGRPAGYDVPDYLHDFSRIAPGLPAVTIAGPSSGSPSWLPQLGRFLAAEPRVRLATVHAYPFKRCLKSTVITIPELLSDSASAGLAQRVAPYLAAASSHHVPLRVDEMNSISCGGAHGVSDTFASALWVLDTLFEMARTGVAGVNVETVPFTPQEVLGPKRVGSAWQIRVHPEFYGLMMFAQAAPAGSRLLSVGASAPAGVKVWATRGPGSATHVVVIDKRLSGSDTVRLRIPGAGGPATITRLSAPRVNATGAVTLGGQSFGTVTSTGALAGAAQQQTVSPVGGVYTVTLPAASAAMLTLTH